MNLPAQITAHYERTWKARSAPALFAKGPIGDLPKGYRVLLFPPRVERRLWTFATCGMAQEADESPIELHVHSEERQDSIVEVLTAVAHFHRTEQPLGVGHIVNFGRAWVPSSKAEFGLVSLPYLDGPDLEEAVLESGKHVRCLWLIPIFASERDYAIANGLEALENKFESSGFNYAAGDRAAVV
jgi:Suppressor of fused protein (SUFU)